MTVIPSLTFTELWVVSMEHLQRVWLANRERLPFRTPGSVPLFDLLVLQLLRPDSSNLPCLTRLFTLNTPWNFLEFAFTSDRGGWFYTQRNVCFYDFNYSIQPDSKRMYSLSRGFYCYCTYCNGNIMFSRLRKFGGIRKKCEGNR